MRQSTFVDQIHQLGWLGPGFIGDPESAPVLQRCMLRYYGLVGFSDLSPFQRSDPRRFLTLIGTDPERKSFFVPTLDVDLVWQWVVSFEFICVALLNLVSS